MSALDHVAISTADYLTSLAFYEKALAPLGIKTHMKFEGEEGNVAGLGSEQPFLWIGDGGKLIGGRVHLAFSAPNRAAVDAFYAAAIAAGGKDNGPPGLRPHYHATYYAAFVFDPDGHNIEAVCHAPE
ncbi:MAG TPA: VOC family protein [Devosia sp.]|jgi:catechol 2,3-dioxygenase-like lactoylglutathione lyase family enzyme|uniref:VOC family protein n=1 Tax=Devosia sp. TaxID=1871048 RepID=UPI002DDCBDAD|nr:VOC family protein [Devosia sp.]HEV2514119.1 VOC family protein [Devosia sp.]